MDVVPVNFGLKYRPPKLGVEYYMREQPQMRFVHEIPLSHVLKSSNTEMATSEMFEKHKHYLNPKVVSQAQVKRLLDKFIRTLYGGGDKENSQLDNNSIKKDSFSLLQGVGKKPQNDHQTNSRKLQPLEMSPTESEQSARGVLNNRNIDNNQSISRIESIKDEDHHDDEFMNDMHQNNQSVNKNDEQEDFDQLMSKSNNYSKEIMMGQTIRDLGSTIKEAKDSKQNNGEKDAHHNISEGDEYNDDFESSQQQHQESMNQMISQEEFSQNQQELMLSGLVEGVGQHDDGGFEGADMSQQQQMEDMEDGGEGDMMQQNQEENNEGEEGEEDVIDIDNPDELAKKGLKRIQIEGEEEEFLMDMEGNIYDLRGNFIGTTDGDGNAAGDSQVMGGDDEQFNEEY